MHLSGCTHHNLRWKMSNYKELPSVHVSVRQSVQGPLKSTTVQVVFMTLTQQDQTINLTATKQSKFPPQVAGEITVRILLHGSYYSGSVLPILVC